MSHYIDMYFIPNFPKLISFGFFILFPDAVVERSFTAAPRAWNIWKESKKYVELPN